MAKKKNNEKKDTKGMNFAEIVGSISGNEFAVEGNSEYSETKNWITTNNILLDYQISAHDGIPTNRVTEICGPFASYKTLLCADIAKNAIEGKTFTGEKYNCLWFEDEGATSKSTLKTNGWNEDDLKQLVWMPFTTIEDLKIQIYRLLKAKQEKQIKENFIIIVDSIGSASSKKEVVDTEEGNDKADMTRAKQIKSFFRLMPKNVELAEVPIILINHTYKTQDMFAQTVVSGGTGAVLGPSHIIELSKKKHDKIINGKKKDIGIILHSKILKSRVSKYNTKVEIPLFFGKKMEYYSGLQEFLEGEKYNVDISDIDSVKKLLKEHFELINLVEGE